MPEHAERETVNVIAQELEELYERGLVTGNRGTREIVWIGAGAGLAVECHMHLLIL
jgi:hypothetical protein